MIKKQKDCYFKYIYYYKSLTQDQEGLNKLKRNKACTCKSCCKSFSKLFLSKCIPHSTLIFILPWFLFTKKDADGCFIKLIVLILYISLFMTFNMTVEFNISYIYLQYRRWWVEESINPLILAGKILGPFLFLYILIAIIKKSLSISVFCLEETERIKHIKDKNRTRNQNRYEKEIKKEKSRLKKYKKEMEKKFSLYFWVWICLFIFLFDLFHFFLRYL